MTRRLAAIMAAALPLLLAFAPVPHWYQSEQVPWAYFNSDGTRMRLYGPTPQDYAEITIQYHGSMTAERALKQVQPYIKKRK